MPGKGWRLLQWFQVIREIKQGLGSHDDTFSVFPWLNLVDSHNPVITGVSFFESSELESFMLIKINNFISPTRSYSDFSSSKGIVTRSTSSVGVLDLIKSVVGELVHKTVKHGFRGLRVNSVLKNSQNINKNHSLPFPFRSSLLP